MLLYTVKVFVFTAVLVLAIAFIMAQATERSRIALNHILRYIDRGFVLLHRWQLAEATERAYRRLGITPEMRKQVRQMIPRPSLEYHIGQDEAQQKSRFLAFLRHEFTDGVRQIVRIEEGWHVIVTRARPDTFVVVYVKPGLLGVRWASRRVVNTLSDVAYSADIQRYRRSLLTKVDRADTSELTWANWITLGLLEQKETCAESRCRICSSLGESPAK